MKIHALSAIAVAGLSGCAALMPPIPPHDNALYQQMMLEQQRANNQQLLEAQKAMMNRSKRAAPPVLTMGAMSSGPVATWTGESQIAQSVTGATGFRCKYVYAGKVFWSFQLDGCPSSIEVQ